jgi:hypothetical protein
MQLKEMVLALLNESDLLLSDDAVEQIVDQVHHIQMKCCSERALTPHANLYILTDIQAGRPEQRWED